MPDRVIAQDELRDGTAVAAPPSPGPLQRLPAMRGADCSSGCVESSRSNGRHLISGWGAGQASARLGR
jgi:hypothetical protein